MAHSLKHEIKVIAKHFSVYGIANVLDRAIAFLLLPLYTSYLTPTDYGILEILYFTTTIVAIAMGMGVSQAMTRFYFDSDRQSDRHLVISTTFFSLGTLSILTAAVFTLSSGWVSRLLFETDAYSLHCKVIFITLGLGFLHDVSNNYFRVEKKSIRLTVFSLSKLLLTIGLNILFLVGLGMGVLGILLGTLLSSLVIGITMITFVLRDVGFGFSLPLLKNMVRFGLPLIPSSTASYLMIASDRYFVKEFVTLQETGLYSIGYKFGAFVSDFVTSAFIQIWHPRRFEYFDKDDSERIFARIFTYFIGLVTAMALALSLFAKEILQVMTTEAFWPAHQIVSIVALAHVFHAMYYHFEIAISYFKKTTYFTYINISTALFNLAMNFVLIKNYGMWGAAYSTLLTYIARATLVYYFSNRLFPMVFEKGRIFRLVAIAGVVYGIGQFVHTGSIIGNIGVKAAVYLLYPVGLLLSGFLESREKQEAIAILRKGQRKLSAFLSRSESKQP